MIRSTSNPPQLLFRLDLLPGADPGHARRAFSQLAALIALIVREEASR
ncbi:MAG: hypothetical protein ACRDLL_04435 [Solirubrobacterales bacterium]